MDQKRVAQSALDALQCYLQLNDEQKEVVRLHLEAVFTAGYEERMWEQRMLRRMAKTHVKGHKVIQYKDGIIIEVHKNVTDAARVAGCTKNGMVQLARRGTYFHGYTWKYA